MDIDKSNPKKNIDINSLDGKLMDSHLKCLKEVESTATEIELQSFLHELIELVVALDKIIQADDGIEIDTETINKYESGVESIRQRSKNIKRQISQLQTHPPAPQFKDTHNCWTEYISEVQNFIEIGENVTTVDNILRITEEEEKTTITTKGTRKDIDLPDPDDIVPTAENLGSLTDNLVYLVERDARILNEI